MTWTTPAETLSTVLCMVTFRLEKNGWIYSLKWRTHYSVMAFDNTSFHIVGSLWGNHRFPQKGAVMPAFEVFFCHPKPVFKHTSEFSVTWDFITLMLRLLVSRISHQTFWNNVFFLETSIVCNYHISNRHHANMFLFLCTKQLRWWYGHMHVSITLW